MNRRDFFKAALGLLGAATLPGISLTAPAQPLADFVLINASKRAADALAKNFAPIFANDIQQLCAREAWKHEYRRARMEIKKMVRNWNGEIGRIESFRFIVSDTISSFSNRVSM